MASPLCEVPSTNACNETADQTQKGSSGFNFETALIILNIVGLAAGILLFILYYTNAKNPKKTTKKTDIEDQESAENEHEENAQKIILQAAEERVVAKEKPKLTFVEDEAGFELDDLLTASAEGLGKGIFGNCYKAKLDGRAAVVVKRLKDLKPLSVEEFSKQIQEITALRHPNLLPLLAYYYCEEKLFVYKYADKGNLFNRLYGGRGSSSRSPFRWSCRLWAARCIARAMEHLHRNAKSNDAVPHGNLKLSNVLLDENETVLVSDYGLTSLVASPVAAQHMASYKSPEYQSTKKATKKSDVWSYGCLLLELLTGRISACSAPPGVNGVDLCRWVHRAVREEWTAEIFDLEISKQRSAAPAMVSLLQVAIRCCEKSPEKRPEMTEVTREVENIYKALESEDEEDCSLQSFTDESVSTSASGGR